MSPQTRDLLLLTIGGVVAASGPLLVTCGPTPGGLCGIPGESASLVYLLGSIGGALVVGGLWREIEEMVKHSSRSAFDSLLAVTIPSSGAAIMMFGLLFTCASSILVAGSGGCGVGPLAGLIAYLFGMLGASLVAIGFLGLGLRRRQASSELTASKPQTKGSGYRSN